MEDVTVVELSPEQEALWDLGPDMLKVCNMIENAVNEIDEEIAKEIRTTADTMAREVLLRYRQHG